MEALKIGYRYVLSGPVIRDGNIPVILSVRLQQKQTVAGQNYDFSDAPIEQRQLMLIRKPKGVIYGYDMSSAPWRPFSGTYDHKTGDGLVFVQVPAHCKQCSMNTAFGASGSLCPHCGTMLTEGWLPATTA